MKIVIEQTHHDIADFSEVFDFLTKLDLEVNSPTLHVFPELFLTGYPLQDIVLQKSFIEAYQNFHKRLADFAKSISNPNICLLLGGIKYSFEDSDTNIPARIENVVFKIEAGMEIESVYTKMLLPNYDIYDEKKYYSAGKQAKFIKWKNKTIGLLICEDMWFSSLHDINPVKNLFDLNLELDLIVNLSASPYNLHKSHKRLARAKDISKMLKAPFVYINKVGAEDEIIFDGTSFAVNGSDLICKLKSFEADQQSFLLPKYNQDKYDSKKSVENTWEGLFSADLVQSSDNKLPHLRELNDESCQEIIDALCFGLQDYAKKSFFKKFLVALSGGLDSALVLALAKISLKPGQELEAIYMPSEFSRDISYKASKLMCDKAKIPLLNLPLNDLHNMCRQKFQIEVGDKLQGVADENIQSRLRGMLLYARSNQSNALVINTSNKSELAVGYSTLYGDSVGALSLLGDLYKSEAYQLAKYINRKYKNLIPDDIITRPPSAELREDQVDTDSLPPYEVMDAILEGILSYRLSGRDLVEAGFSKKDVSRVLDLYRKVEYKRYQFCPILKIKSKSFGFGYRVPLCKNTKYYCLD